MLRINLQQQIKIHQINLVPFKQIKKLWLLPINTRHGNSGT
jgi:hypothetical protein